MSANSEPSPEPHKLEEQPLRSPVKPLLWLLLMIAAAIVAGVLRD